MQYMIVHRVKGVDWYVLDRRSRCGPKGSRHYAQHAFRCHELHEQHTVAPNIAHAREVRDAYIEHETQGGLVALEGRVLLRKYTPPVVEVRP